MPLSAAFSFQILDALLRGAPIPASAPYLAASSTVPNADGTNWTEHTPATWGNYARATLSSAIAIGSGGGSNAQVIDLPTPTTANGSIAAIGFWTAATGGELRAWVPMTPAVPLVAGVPIRVPVGQLVAQVSP